MLESTVNGPRGVDWGQIQSPAHLTRFNQKKKNGKNKWTIHRHELYLLLLLFCKKNRRKIELGRPKFHTFSGGPVGRNWDN